MWHYCGFGLGIKAPLQFPELPERCEDPSAPCDIEISIGTVPEHPESLDEMGRGFWTRDKDACYSWEGVGVFLVSDGCRILAEPHPDAPEQVVRLCILGPVFSLLLLQRGFFTLHASAVSFQGEAVAFLGGHGWGKSTMAALLQELGHPVISDDLTAIELQQYRVVPSFPQLKLWPDAVDALGHNAEKLPLVHPDVDKRALRSIPNFAQDSLPLRRLYLLGPGEEISIEHLNPIRVFEELNRHWYCARFGKPLIESIGLKSHFTTISSLARTAPLRRLCRPASLHNDANLGKSIEDAILEDLESS